MVFKLAPLLTFLFQFLWNQTTIFWHIFSVFVWFIKKLWILQLQAYHRSHLYTKCSKTTYTRFILNAKIFILLSMVMPLMFKVLWFCGRGTLPVWAWPTIFFSSKYKVDFFLFCFLHLFLQDILNHIWQKKLRSVVLNYTLFLGSFVCLENTDFDRIR